jgi:hypothetical protein
VRAHIRRAALKDPDKVVAGLMKGVDSPDPMISARSAVQLLEQGFGRVGAAAAEESEPSLMISSLFRRPARDGQGDELFAVLRDGRILRVGMVDFEPEPTPVLKPAG